jgi:SAM-dependent methyltransferase
MEINKDYFDEDYFEKGEKSNYKGYGDYPFFKDFANFIKLKYNPKSAYDVGCAKGFIVKHLRLLGVSAFGCDISPYAIEKNHEESKPFVVVKDFSKDFENYGMINPKFDVVLSLDVIEHIPGDRLKIFTSNLFNITEKILIISTPIVPEGSPSYDGGRDKSHISLHSENYWINLFKECGFKFIERTKWDIPRSDIPNKFWELNNMMVFEK